MQSCLPSGTLLAPREKRICAVAWQGALVDKEDNLSDALGEVRRLKHPGTRAEREVPGAAASTNLPTMHPSSRARARWARLGARGSTWITVPPNVELTGPERQDALAARRTMDSERRAARVACRGGSG